MSKTHSVLANLAYKYQDARLSCLLLPRYYVTLIYTMS
jgi:hypothetical protein